MGYMPYEVMSQRTSTGIEFYIGLPKSFYHRVPRLEPMKVDLEKLTEILNSFRGDVELNRLAFSQPKDWFSVCVGPFILIQFWI